jgi:hypothetical protein
MEFMVRPFKLVVEDAASPAASVHGDIEQDSLLVSIEGRHFDGARFTLPTSSVGVDESGAFAMVPRVETTVEGDWMLLVEPDPGREGAAPGCRIAVISTPGHKEVSVCFDGDGSWGGTGYGFSGRGFREDRTR